MISCQLMLVVFATQWLYSQYTQQQAELKKDLTKLFGDVQHKISDSLLLQRNQVKFPLQSSEVAVASVPAATGRAPQRLSAQGLQRLLTNVGKPLTHAEQANYFGIDTIVFNELFAREMRHNGWNFRSQWISSADSDNRQASSIFISSSFFTDNNGVVIDNFSGYLRWKVLPQAAFILVLLFLTGAAFWLAYRSLKAQISLSQMKDDFISNMSHELKTPIATVKVALEALNTFNIIDDPVKGRAYLGMATSEMDRLELLATQVLNTSLMETGNICLQREAYNLDALLKEVLLGMQLRMEQLGARAALHISGNNFSIPMDKLHLQGVLVNLLDNSLKYGGKNVFIDIRLTEEQGAVRLEFCDNGPGIPDEYRERVFEKFFRVPSGNRHRIKGHGLGLSYAAHVMRQHNGAIGVRNLVSGGCMFTLTF